MYHSSLQCISFNVFSPFFSFSIYLQLSWLFFSQLRIIVKGVGFCRLIMLWTYLLIYDFLLVLWELYSNIGSLVFTWNDFQFFQLYSYSANLAKNQTSFCNYRATFLKRTIVWLHKLYYYLDMIFCLIIQRIIICCPLCNFCLFGTLGKTFCWPFNFRMDFPLVANYFLAAVLENEVEMGGRTIAVDRS